MYNAPGKWTAPLHFREILRGYEFFDKQVLDFRYHLIHVFSYREDELLKMSNLMGAVFLLDQAKDLATILDRLKKLMDTMKKMEPEEFGLFTTWAGNILSRGVSPPKRDEIVDLLKNASPKEVETMISHVGKALEREMKNAEKRWMEKGMEKGMVEAKLAMARQMLTAGEPIEKITQYTGLSREMVENLAEQGKQ